VYSSFERENKCNIDATILKNKTCFSAGMCVENERDEFIYAQIVWKKVNKHFIKW